MPANTFPLHWISSLCKWEGHHSHDPPAVVACWLLADFSQHIEHWLWDCRIVISVSKSTVVFFVQTARCIWELQLVQVFGQPVHWVYNTHYLGGDSWCTANMFGTYKSGWEKAAQTLGVLDPHLNISALSSLKNFSALWAAHSSTDEQYIAYLVVHHTHSHQDSAVVTVQGS